MPSKIFERYDVVVVPFPFTDLASEKRRPAVALSGAEAFNSPSAHVVLALVTSEADRTWPLGVPLTDLASAGLNVACAVRFKLFTRDDRLILRKAGSLGAPDRKAMDAAVRGLSLGWRRCCLRWLSNFWHKARSAFGCRPPFPWQFVEIHDIRLAAGFAFGKALVLNRPKKGLRGIFSTRVSTTTANPPWSPFSKGGNGAH